MGFWKAVGCIMIAFAIAIIIYGVSTIFTHNQILNYISLVVGIIVGAFVGALIMNE